MNKSRRKALEAISAKVRELHDELDTLREEEQEYFDNMPESLQDGEKGDAAQVAIDAMEEAMTALEEAASQLDTASE